MISSCFDEERNEVITTMAFPTLISAGPADIFSIRDALADVLQTVISHEDPKAEVKPDSLFIVSEMINTLTNDLERVQKGGVV